MNARQQIGARRKLLVENGGDAAQSRAKCLEAGQSGGSIGTGEDQVEAGRRPSLLLISQRFAKCQHIGVAVCTVQPVAKSNESAWRLGN